MFVLSVFEIVRPVSPPTPLSFVFFVGFAVCCAVCFPCLAISSLGGFLVTRFQITTTQNILLGGVKTLLAKHRHTQPQPIEKREGPTSPKPFKPERPPFLILVFGNYKEGR